MIAQVDEPTAEALPVLETGVGPIGLQVFRFAVAEPPKLLRTLIRRGLSTHPRWSAYRPPPLFVSVNMKLPDDEYTVRMAFGFVLVASMVRSPDFQLALVMRTTSAAGGAPGVTVIVAVLVTPNHEAVTVTLVLLDTGAVDRLKVPVDALAFTTVSWGTCATAGLLLAS